MVDIPQFSPGDFRPSMSSDLPSGEYLVQSDLETVLVIKRGPWVTILWRDGQMRCARIVDDEEIWMYRDARVEAR